MKSNYATLNPQSRLVAIATVILLGVTNAQAAVIPVVPEVVGGDVDEFAVSPDGTQIAFVGSLDNGIVGDQVYLIPIGGGNATLLNPNGVGDVDGEIIFTPDGTNVIARYGGGTGNIDNQFYLMPTNGSQAAQQLTFNNFNVFDPKVSSDGSTLFYVDALNDNTTDLDDVVFSTSISDAQNAPAPTQVSPTSVSEVDTDGYDLIGSDLIFAADPSTGGETQFYRIANDGTGSLTDILISNTPAFGFDIDEMAITPDGQSIIFVADLTTDGVDELYSMPIAGGVATQLLPTIPSFADVGSFAISPDGSTIAFQADFEANGVGEAYVIPASGGVPVQVSEDLTGVGYNADVVAGAGRLAFTPDSSSVIYLADSRENGVNELHIVPVPNAVPEPTSALALGSLIAAAAGVRRRTPPSSNKTA